jgi:hypothetical protein
MPRRRRLAYSGGAGTHRRFRSLSSTRPQRVEGANLFAKLARRHASPVLRLLRALADEPEGDQ